MVDFPFILDSSIEDLKGIKVYFIVKKMDILNKKGINFDIDMDVFPVVQNL